MREESNKAGESCKQKEILELYKLHAELADRVIQRRDGVNRLYASLLAGVATAGTIIIRLGGSDIPIQVVIILGALGLAISSCWHITLRGYQQPLNVKFGILEHMEKDLSYQFFTKESDVLKNIAPEKLSIFLLPNKSNLLPFIFYMFFAVWIIINLPM